jgi:hypothetical protein
VLLQVSLHFAVFEAVESDDEQAAARLQDLRGGGEDGGQRFELLVDRHADRLETAGGWMRFPAAADGFLDASSMCAAFRKRFKDYLRTETTQAFVQALAADICKNGHTNPKGRILLLENICNQMFFTATRGPL